MAREHHYCEKCNEQTTIWASSRREAERKLEWWKRNRPICTSCEKAAELDAAKAYIAEMELPSLTGSPELRKSAEMTRARMLKQIIKKSEYPSEQVITAFRPSSYGNIPTLDEVYTTTAIAMIERAKDHMCGITDAGWWYDVRHITEVSNLLFKVMKHLEEESLPEAARAVVEAVDLETTLRPEMPVSELIAITRIRPAKQLMTIKFAEKHDSFTEAVKAFNGRWNSGPKSWFFTVPDEAYPDLNAEIVAHLLGSGFPVRVEDTAVREMAIAGTFRKSDGRRIDYAGKDCFRVDWRRIDGDFYDEVRKIHGAAWDKENQTVLVPIGAADDLRDFAERFGFPLTDQAKAAAVAFDHYRRAGTVEGK